MKRITPALLLLFPLSLLAAAGKFGAPLGDSPKVALADLVKDAVSYSGKTVKTEGVISTVCQEKGCWMTLKSGDQTVRVTFKDYGFFVPKDSAGATAVMEGVFSVKTIPEAKAKHYASETPGGKPDAIKGDQKELSLVASGVEIAAGEASRGLVGSWLVSASRPGGQGVVLLTFTSDGTFFRSGDTHPVLSVAHGAWKRISDREFDATYIALRFDENRKLVGTQKTRIRIAQDPGEKEFTGVAKVSFLDLDGKEERASETRLAGKRIQVEPF